MTEYDEMNVFDEFERIEISIINKVDKGFDKNIIDALYSCHFEEGDPHTIYNNIKKIERALVVDRSFNKLFELVCEAYIINPERIITLINNKKTIIEIYFFVRCFKNEIIIEILEGPLILRSHLIFMCIRKLTNKSSKKKKELNKVDFDKILSNAIIKISTIDENLWSYIIFYFENNLEYYSVFGIVLEKINDQSLIIFAQSINLRIRESSLVQISQIFISLSDDRLYAILNKISPIIKNRWFEYLSELKQDKKFFNGLIQTGYIDLVYWSIYYSITDIDCFEKELNNQFIILNNDAYCWYKNIIDFRTNYFIDYTQIGLLSQVYIEKNYKFTQTLEIQEMVKQLEIIFKRYEDLWDNSTEEAEFIYKKLKKLNS